MGNVTKSRRCDARRRLSVRRAECDGLHLTLSSQTCGIAWDGGVMTSRFRSGRCLRLVRGAVTVTRSSAVQI